MARQDESAVFAKHFIDKRAPGIHGVFGVESHFNITTSMYQSKEVYDLQETLKRYQKQATDLADFDFDLLSCTWQDVLGEMKKAEAAASESHERGKKFHTKAWRALGTMGDVISPALEAMPDELCVLHGGIAVIFSLARHRAQNREKILRAFGNLPNVIEMAQNKAKSLLQHSSQPESIRLHKVIRELQQTLLRILPDLIERLNPGTFLGKALSPFKGASIDDLLDAVSDGSDKVRVCAEGMMDDIIVNTHKTMNNDLEMTKNIQNIAQHTSGEVEALQGKVDELLMRQKSLQLNLDAISGKNGLLDFLIEYLKPRRERSPETISTESLPDSDSRSSFEPGQLLTLMNVHHLLAIDDEAHIIRRGRSIDAAATAQAATMVQTPQVQQLFHEQQSGIVLVDGCADRSQMSKASPLSHICATLSAALRSGPPNVTLTFFCGQHLASNDDLQGPQGLMRALVASLILSLIQNKLISESMPLQLPDLPGEVENLLLKDICELFHRLLRLVPRKMPVYCLVDGVSYYERDIWREDFSIMMICFGNIIDDETLDTFFKLLLTSPTRSRSLCDLMPHQRVSLRGPRVRTTAASERDFRS